MVRMRHVIMRVKMNLNYFMPKLKVPNLFQVEIMSPKATNPGEVGVKVIVGDKTLVGVVLSIGVHFLIALGCVEISTQVGITVLSGI